MRKYFFLFHIFYISKKAFKILTKLKGFVLFVNFFETVLNVGEMKEFYSLLINGFIFLCINFRMWVIFYTHGLFQKRDVKIKSFLLIIFVFMNARNWFPNDICVIIFGIVPLILILNKCISVNCSRILTSQFIFL